MLLRVLLLLAFSAVLATPRATAQRMDSVLSSAINDPAETFGEYDAMPAVDDYAMPDYGDYRHFYEQAVAFDYGFLRMRPRGFSQRYDALFFEDLPMRDPFYDAPMWSAMTGLHTATSTYSSARYPLIRNDEYYNVYDNRYGRVGYSFSNRTYTHSVTAIYNTGVLKNGWHVAAAGAFRGGRSLTTDGVWANGFTGTVSFGKRFGKRGMFNFTLFYSPMERAYASASTQEAFALTGNNLYNPSWGYQGGTAKKDERSSKIRSAQLPVATFKYACMIGRSTRLRVLLSGSYGRLSNSALNWQDAANPYPDYYRNMPSYQTDPVVRERLTQLWANDPTVSQINFPELYDRNRATSSAAHYIMENRVRDLATAAASINVDHYWPSGGVTLSANASFASERNYKTVRDLMGARYWLDVDHFLESDDDFREMTQVNMAEPNRHVEVGDVFGYNYRLQHVRGWIEGRVIQQLGKNVSLLVSGEAGLYALSRYGYWEKQNFAGDQSLGASSTSVRLEGQLNAEVTYRFGGRWYIAGQVITSSKAPTARDMLLNPQYRNAFVADPVNEKFFAGLIHATYRAPKLRALVNIYYAQTRDITRLHHLYDDIEGAYVDMVMRRVATEHLGFEVSVEVLLTRDLWLKGMFNLPIARYIGNPEATTYRQTTGEELKRQTVYFDNLRVASAPSFLASGALSYEPRGWTVTVTANGFGNSYVTPSPTRYTEAAARKAANATMTTQEIMPAGVTLNLFGGKTFYLPGYKRINLYAGINNVLNNRNIAVSGYQSYRLSRDTQGRYTPHDTRYNYGLGINGFLSASFIF